jgi:uncharacterized phage protein (TIGR01671 family)
MSRVIKFRVWYPEYQEMDVIEDLYFFEENSINTIPEDTDRHGMVIMQFTGLHDRHDKEIWEGDIITFQLIEGGKRYTGIVEYRSARFMADATSLLSSVMYQEVIGNIYETPELLPS